MAYQFGVLKAFREAHLEFDAVSGTSVGALNAALWATNQMELGHSIWANITQAAIMPWADDLPFRRVRTALRMSFHAAGIEDGRQTARLPQALGLPEGVTHAGDQLWIKGQLPIPVSQPSVENWSADGHSHPGSSV